MVYEFGTEIREVTLAEVSPNHPTMGLVTMDELREHAHALGFAESTINLCENDEGGFRGALDLYDTYSFGVLYIVNLGDILGTCDRIGMYVKKNFFLLVEVYDEDKSTQRAVQFAVEHAHKGTVCLERLFYLVLERILYGGGKALEKISYAIDAMGPDLSTRSSVHEFNRIVLQKKKELLVLHNYYDQVIDVGEELQENNGGFFTAENQRYFKLFTDKAERLSNSTQLLHESLMQVREGYNTMVSFHQSQTMKALAVLTAIFAPLSLITNWYGMNFKNMPMLHWQYGPYVVMGFSVVAVCICLFLTWRNGRKL